MKGSGVPLCTRISWLSSGQAVHKICRLPLSPIFPRVRQRRQLRESLIFALVVKVEVLNVQMAYDSYPFEAEDAEQFDLNATFSY